jgi:hypothetical protein
VIGAPGSTTHLQPRVLHDVDVRESGAIAKLTSLLMHNAVCVEGRQVTCDETGILTFAPGEGRFMMSEFLGIDEIEDMRRDWKGCIGLLGFPRK